LHERITRPGVAIGLAFTQVGGRALLIETSKYSGSGVVNLTG
jgi:ATP-dependent Lon protease